MKYSFFINDIIFIVLVNISIFKFFKDRNKIIKLNIHKK